MSAGGQKLLSASVWLQVHTLKEAHHSAAKIKVIYCRRAAQREPDPSVKAKVINKRKTFKVHSKKTTTLKDASCL